MRETHSCPPLTSGEVLFGKLGSGPRSRSIAVGEVPAAIQRHTRALAAQLSDYDRQLTETDRACGRYSAQIRFLELEPGIEHSRRGLQRLRARALELGAATLSEFDAVAAAADPARWRPTPEDLKRRF